MVLFVLIVFGILMVTRSHKKSRKKNLSNNKKKKARKRIKPHVSAQPVAADEQLLHCS